MKKTNTLVKLVVTVACAAWCLAAVPLASAQHVQQTATCVNGQTVTYDDSTSSADQACAAIGSSYKPGDFKSFTCQNGNTIAVPSTATNEQATLECAARGFDHPPGEADPQCYSFNLASKCGVQQDKKDCAFGTAQGNENCIMVDVQAVMDFLAVGVGIIVTIMIVIGAIQYLTSADNPQAVQAAKGRIINAIIALLAFLFLYAFLQWLVPGGIF